jgi:hypothetical protein
MFAIYTGSERRDRQAVSTSPLAAPHIVPTLSRLLEAFYLVPPAPPFPPLRPSMYPFQSYYKIEDRKKATHQLPPQRLLFTLLSQPTEAPHVVEYIFRLSEVDLLKLVPKLDLHVFDEPTDVRDVGRLGGERGGVSLLLLPAWKGAGGGRRRGGAKRGTAGERVRRGGWTGRARDTRCRRKIDETKGKVSATVSSIKPIRMQRK